MVDNRKLMLAAVLVAGTVSVVWYMQKPHMNMTAMPAENSQSGPLAQVMLPASLSAGAQQGKTAFDVKCAICHGENAAGRNGAGPPLVHKIYEPNHHGDMAFLRAAQNGVKAHHWRFGNMPPVEGVTRGDVLGIVTYIRELQQENGIN